MEHQDNDYGKKGIFFMYVVLSIIFFLSILVYIYKQNAVLTFN